ncbi:MAG TPA: tetratricopeptide repeat protein, partial [Planctomycetota bacterium]|nr:tetratricopeptide repeat protein [Planctomycetota bacterium]
RELRDRLARRLQLLRARSSPETRHGSLQGALDASWDLLEPWEQAAVVQCSVFAGRFTADDANAVLEPSADRTTEDAVQALVEHSLLYGWAVQGRPRLGMYVSVRLWAGAKGPTAAAEARHGAWFAALGSLEALRVHHGPDGAAALARVVEVLDDLVLATRRAVERGDAAVSVNAAAAACAALEHTGPFAAAVPLCDAVLGLRGLSAEQRARILGLRGWMRLQQGELDAATADLDAGLGAAEDPRISARILASRAGLRRARGDLSGARAGFEQALAAYEAAAEPHGQAAATANLGTVALDRGDVDAALARFGQALAMHRALGDRRGEGTVLGNLASTLHLAGRLDDAERTYRQALDLHRELGHRVHEAVVLSNLAAVDVARGELDEAERLLYQALDAHRQVGNRRGEAVTCASLGTLARRRGPPADPREWFDRAVLLLEQVGDGA